MAQEHADELRPANGTLTGAGRPPLGAATKRQVTLRLDADVIDRFREGGPGWRGRIDVALLQVVRSERAPI